MYSLCLQHPSLSLQRFGENPAHHQPFFALTPAAPLRDVVLGAPHQGGGFPLYGFHRFHRMPRPGDLDAANPEQRAPRWSLDN